MDLISDAPVTKVFIGGSRQVSRLNADVRQRLDRIVERNLPVVVGDANGADKAIQRYLQAKDYRQVEVFCSGSECRNNLGGWDVRFIQPPGSRHDFAFYAAKDTAMAREASVGLMIWDRRSVGTLMNAQRLAEQDKKVGVYLVPDKRFVDVKTGEDWRAFLAGCPPDVRRKLEQKAESESVPAAAGSRQAGLF